MRRRGPLGHLLCGGAVALAAVTVAAGPGHAATVEAAGWWTATPLALAPDAPADALVVEGGITEPRAYSAVRYSLAAGERAVTLTLTLAAGAASTPNSTLRLCVLTELFRPVRGGSITDAPDFDCASPVEVGPSGDGTTYTFDVAGLVSDSELAVAILPTAATDRVVLSDPAADALTTAAATPAPVRTAPSGSTPRDDAAVPSVPVQAPASAPPATPRPGVGAVVPSVGRGAPAVSPTTTAPPPTRALPPSLPSGTTTSASPVSSSSRTSWLPPTVFVGLAALAAALWAGRRADDDLVDTPPVSAATALS